MSVWVIISKRRAVIQKTSYCRIHNEYVYNISLLALFRNINYKQDKQIWKKSKTFLLYLIFFKQLIHIKLVPKMTIVWHLTIFFSCSFQDRNVENLEKHTVCSFLTYLVLEVEQWSYSNVMFKFCCFFQI